MPVGGESAGLDFVMNVRVEGNAEKELTKVSKLVDNINSSDFFAGKAGGKMLVPPDVSQFVTGFAGPGGAGKGLLEGAAGISAITSGLGGLAAGAGAAGLAVMGVKAAIDSMLSSMEAVKSFGEGLTAAGVSFFERSYGIAQLIMDEIAPIEQSMIRIKALGSLTMEEARHRVELAQELVVYTPFLEHQVVQLAAALTGGKVALDAYTDSQGKAVDLARAQAEGWAKVDDITLKMAGRMKVTAASLVADLAAMVGVSGQRMDFFVRGFERALLTGQLRMLDELPPNFRKQIFGSVSKMKVSASEAMDNLYKMMQEKHAIGTAAMASSTMEGIRSNFHDMRLQVAKAIGGMPGTGGYFDQLKNGMANMFSEIMNVLNDPDWQKGIKSTLAPLITTFVALMGVLKYVFGWSARLAGSFPVLGKIVVIGAMIGSVLLIVTGVIITLTSAFGILAVTVGVGLVAALAVAAVAFSALFILTITGVIPVLIQLALMVGAVLAPFILLGAVIGALGVALGILIVKSAPFEKFMSNISVLGQAVAEALENWGGATTKISEQTAEKLHEAGMLNFFMDIVKTIRDSELWMKRLWNSITAGADIFAEETKGPLDELFKAFSELGDALTTVGKAFGLIDTGPIKDTSEDTKVWGDQIAAIAHGLAVGVSMMAKLVILAIDIAIWLMKVAINAQLIGQYISLWVTSMGIVGEAIWRSMIGPLDIVMSAISGIAKALSALSSGNLEGVGDALKGIRDDWANIVRSQAGFGVESVERLRKQREEIDATKARLGELKDMEATAKAYREGGAAFVPGAGPGGPFPNMPRSPEEAQQAGEAQHMVAGGTAMMLEQMRAAFAKRQAPPVVNIKLTLDRKELAAEVAQELREQGELGFATPE